MALCSIPAVVHSSAIFCDVTSLYGHGQRTKNPDQIIAELELILQKDHVPTILFADDNIIGNKTDIKTGIITCPY